MLFQNHIPFQRVFCYFWITQHFKKSHTIQRVICNFRVTNRFKRSHSIPKSLPPKSPPQHAILQNVSISLLTAHSLYLCSEIEVQMLTANTLEVQFKHSNLKYQAPQNKEVNWWFLLISRMWQKRWWLGLGVYVLD